MNTPSDSNSDVIAQEEQQPVNSFTRVIEVAPSGAAFGGWGPKVVGPLSMLTRWN